MSWVANHCGTRWFATGDEQDAARTRFLEAKGFKVIRFWDNEVHQQSVAVLQAILNSVGDRTHTPAPLPKGEEPKEQSA